MKGEVICFPALSFVKGKDLFMFLILEGNSEGAHVRSYLGVKIIFFLHTRAMCSELPSNVNTMGSLGIYEIICFLLENTKKFEGNL